MRGPIFAILYFILFNNSFMVFGSVPIAEKIFFVSTELLSFKEAVQFCLRPEFHTRFQIADVQSEDDNSKATEALLVYGSTSQAWTGIYKSKDEFLSGNNQQLQYLNFNSGQPKNASDRCVVLTNTGFWNSANCKEKHRALCQGFAFTKMYIAQNGSFTRDDADEQCELGLTASLLSKEETRSAAHQIRRGRPPAKGKKKRTKEQKQNAVCRKKRRQCLEQLSFCEGDCLCDIPVPAYCCKKGSTNPACRSKRRYTDPPFSRTNDNEDEGHSFLLETLKQTLLDKLEKKKTKSPSGVANPSPAEFQAFLSARNLKISRSPLAKNAFFWDTPNLDAFEPIGFLSEDTQIFLNFEEGYPKPNSNLACLAVKENGKWINVDCEETVVSHLLCEVQVAASKQYKAFPQQLLTQDDAAAFCAAQLVGGQLASIKTKTEQSLLHSEIEAACESGCSTTQFWLSARKASENLFNWGDGQLMNRNGKPVGLIQELLGTNGDCVVIDSTTNQWIREDCNQKFSPICEYPSTESEPSSRRRQLSQTKIFGVDDFCYNRCDPKFIDDDYCDPHCRTIGCNMDSDRCAAENPLPCAPGCTYDMLHNEICDPSCFNANCAFDIVDCGRDDFPQLYNRTFGQFQNFCSATCTGNDIGDRRCDRDICGYECEKADCFIFDNPSIEQCNYQCSFELLQNTVCDEVCNNAACNFDNGKCSGRRRLISVDLI